MPPESAQSTDFSAHYIMLPKTSTAQHEPVKAWEQDVEILTYSPEWPERNPMFLENRVYQGSSGRVYPLPCIDRIAIEPAPKLWKSVHIMHLFNEDLALRNRVASLFLRAQALVGMNRAMEAQGLLDEVMAIDSSHAGASDFAQQLGQLSDAGPVR